MNALVPFSPIPVPSNPARLPSLPAWLQQLSAVLGSATQRDSNGRLMRRPTLPQSMILTSSERDEVLRHVGALQPFTRLDQSIELRGSVMSNDQAHGVMIASLLLKGGAKLDKQSSDAFTEDYLDAIGDIPAWAVREAIRKWNRAESQKLDGKPHNYEFRPAPPILRQLANHELANVKARLKSLYDLLEAVPAIEFSEEHCAEMREKLRGLATTLRTMPQKPISEAAE